MCKFALFVLVAVAGSCFVACQKKLSDACKPTLEVMKKQGKEMEKDGPDCIKAWREQYNPSGVVDLPEYFNGMIAFFKEVDKEEMKECSKEAFPYMHGKMEKMPEFVAELKAAWEENTECMEMLGEIGNMIMEKL